MPLVTDWIMVGITAVYVVATVFICWANIRSAKATREQLAKSQQQLEESRKQFEISQIQIEETRRLEHMPFLMLDFPFQIEEPPVCEIELTADLNADESGYRIAFLKNIGNGTATNIVYSWKYGEIFECEPFPVSSIMKADGLLFQITIFHDGLQEESTGTLTLQFDDLMEQSYEQDINVKFENGIVTNVDVCSPKYRGTILYSLPQKKQNENGDTDD